MTGYDTDSSLKLSDDALKKVSVATATGSDSSLIFNNSAWSFDPTDSELLDVLITDEEGQHVEEKSFNQPFILIGRSAKCDLRLKDEAVSFRHAYLQRMYGRVLCVDLASRSGTYWDQRDQPFGWFDEHHPIRIGPYHLRLSTTILEDEPDEPEFDPRSFFRTFSDQAVLPTVSIQQLARSGPGESWTINRPITLVGSCSRCRLKLSHRSVSKVHCSLLLMPDGLWVVDLLGKDGTFVNGQSIRYTRITDGSTLKVGRFTFRIAYETTSPSLFSTVAKGVPSIPAPASGVTEEFVLQLMQQITNMQQQFLAQSQQQTEMLMHVFGTMQSNQHELLRDEMARLHEINREMRDLKQQLDRPPQTPQSERKNLSRGATAGSDAESPDRPAAKTESSEIVHLKLQFEQLRHQLLKSKESAAREAQAQQEEAKRIAEANWRLQKAADLDRSAVDPVHPEQQVRQDLADDSNVAEPTVSETEDVEETIEPFEQEQALDESVDSPDTEMNHHGWVLERMNKLENERKGLLRKMLNSLFSSNG